MRIGCLQFGPVLGDVEGNIARAESLLESSSSSSASGLDLDLLMLPELAFSGYNFSSLDAISPYLEPTASGPSAAWAVRTSRRLHCHVSVGYPEVTDRPSLARYNSVVLVDPNGGVVVNYRKSFLYYTDETWAGEGPTGFYAGTVPGFGDVAMGICMDINPYRFEAAWTAYEFGRHVRTRSSDTVLVTMAWLTSESLACPVDRAEEPHIETLSYWLARLQPVLDLRDGKERVFAFCNRSGSEGAAHYAGTSAVLKIKDGVVALYGLLGQGQERLLVADTMDEGQARRIYMK